MNQPVASAVFDSREEALSAVSELRSRGIADSAISVIGRQDGKTVDADGAGDVNASGGVKGAVIGAGAGTLLGIAALAIPGVGPFVAAGAIAATAIPEAALIGAAVGGAAGGLTGLLTNHGVDDEDASYYEGRINDGGVFVSVNTENAGLTSDAARDILYRFGGHSATRARTAAM